jgi:hypothetical protein
LVRHFEFGIERPVEAARDEFIGNDCDDRVVNLDPVPVERNLQAVEPRLANGEVSTTPKVNVSAVSGSRSGLPPANPRATSKLLS